MTAGILAKAPSEYKVDAILLGYVTFCLSLASIAEYSVVQYSLSFSAMLYCSILLHVTYLFLCCNLFHMQLVLKLF
jgi:hypothetical protein